MIAANLPLPDSPSCRKCGDAITLPGYEVSADAKPRCPDANGDICARCCPECRKDAELSRRADFARTQSEMFGMYAITAIDASRTWAKVGRESYAEMSRMRAEGFAAVAWRYAREAKEIEGRIS